MSSTRGRRRRARTLSPAVAALLSALVPGWGQYLQGRRRSAVLYLRGAVLLVTLLLLAVAAGPTQLAVWLVDPTVLLGLIVVNGVVALFRLAAVWDAGRGSRGAAAGLVALVLVVLVAVPHLALGWGQVRTYNFLTAVFGEEPQAAPPSTTSAPTTTLPTTSDPGTSPTTTVPTTTTAPPAPWQDDQRLNLLLLGGDAGVGRTGVRTDTVILASVGLERGDVALFGFPRNLSGLTFADGAPFTAYQGILNEVYLYGLDHPERFPGPDPGAEALEEVIEGIAGVEVDYHVLVNLEAFVEVVDALGGVTMYVPERVVDPAYPKEDGTTVEIRIDQGVQTFDGTTALAYVRSRRLSSDYDRMARQRCFLTALAAQADVPSLLRALPTLFDIIQANVSTDIPLDALPDLIRLVGDVDATGALAVGLSPPDWNDGWVGTGYPVPDVPKIQEAVALALADPAAARERYGLEAAGESCGFGDDPTRPPTTTTTTAPATTTSVPTGTTGAEDNSTTVP